jgi:hypothetical protein
MSNLQPTPITDKNGKQTTVHKKTGSTETGTSRVAGLTAPKKTEKRNAVKPGKYDYPDWVRENRTLELGTKQENGSQNIYLDGKVIGSVSSDLEAQYSKIANSRLIRYTSEKQMWRVEQYGSEEKLPFMRGQGSSSSRTRTVSDYADLIMRVHRNIAASKNFLDEGGVAFDRTSDYAFGARGYAIDLPKDWRPNFYRDNGYANVMSSIELNVPGGKYVNIYPNDFGPTSANSGHTVTYRVSSEDGYRNAPINEDGELDLSDVDTSQYPEFFDNLRTLTKKITETSELPNKMELF